MDIVTLPVEYDDDRIDSRFRVVSIAAQRAKELAFGVQPKIKPRGKKPATIAIEETVEGVLDYLVGDEAVAARQEAGKFDYRRLLEERKREAMSEDLSELEKDLRVYLHGREEGAGAAADTRALEDIFKGGQENSQSSSGASKEDDSQEEADGAGMNEEEDSK